MFEAMDESQGNAPSESTKKAVQGTKLKFAPLRGEEVA